MWITIGLNKKKLITFLTSNYHKQLPLCCRVVSLCSVSEPRPHHADLPPSGAAEHVWSAILFGWAGALLLHHDKPNSMFVCTSLWAGLSPWMGQQIVSPPQPCQPTASLCGWTPRPSSCPSTMARCPSAAPWMQVGTMEDERDDEDAVLWRKMTRKVFCDSATSHWIQSSSLVTRLCYIVCVLAWKKQLLPYHVLCYYVVPDLRSEPGFSDLRSTMSYRT